VADQETSPSTELDALVEEALQLTRKARKHNKSLGGDNFYGNKLAKLRADATNTFADLTDATVGDTSALAELIEAVFSAATSAPDRLAAARELSHTLRTSRKRQKAKAASPGNELFPLVLITKANRGYLVTITNQMNGCFREGWYDACAVMMRRLVELVLIAAFDGQGIEHKIKDARGDYVQLSDLIDRALAEPKLKLSRNSKKELPKLRNLGHRSAHGRHFTAQASDIQKVEDGLRVVVEEFLHHAGLL
jgi:hypothetical protein